MEIGSLVPKKRIFKAFYHIWARVPSGHVINIILTYFHFLAYKIWSKKVKWVLSFKSSSYLNGLRPKSRNDLDLEYSYTFSHSSIYLLLPMFRSQAAIV